MPELPGQTAPRGGLIGAMLWPARQLRRLYSWVLGWSNTRYGTPALFVLGFIEVIFFPIPPDPLLVALCLGKRKRSLWYATVCTAAGVLGALVGWMLGMWLFGLVSDTLYAIGQGAAWFGTEAGAAGLTPQQVAALPSAGGTTFYPDGLVHDVKLKIDENALWAYYVAALTPLPDKVFIIVGGLFEVTLPLVLLGICLGRGTRFFSLALMILFFGDRVKPFIEKYFEWLAVALVLVGVGGFVAIKYLL